MILPSHSLDWFFRIYTWWQLKRNFEQVAVHGSIDEAQSPLLVIANHVSWWDGFWVYHVNDHYLKKRFHVMMLEEQLSKNKILSKAGAFSIKKNSRSVVESLRYASNLLKEGNNMLLLFPQGEIASQYLTDFRFEQGVQYLMQHAHPNLRVLFLANMTDYFSAKKPYLDIYMEEYCGTGSREAMETAYNAFYKDCLEKQFSHRAGIVTHK